MKLSEHKDLKIAITDLPIKEKDKLLLRLIAKDKVLTEHLHYKLLEDDSDLELRKESIKLNIEDQLTELKKLTTKEALVKVRKMIALVNHFYKVTKDAFGEVELKIFILNTIPLSYKRNVFSYRDFNFLFAAYFIKTTQATLSKLNKLHEDLKFDLSTDTNALLKRIHSANWDAQPHLSELPKHIE
ncbi:hypothetical protein [Pedobacter sp. MW01-1-1]|uniref:hypothetical protein n=1 Tax=Pedobacter sp. MW01-1-1 TaxID=3383027 RepID=UPI003FF04959